jgi:hypothetical protein
MQNLATINVTDDGIEAAESVDYGFDAYCDLKKRPARGGAS